MHKIKYPPLNVILVVCCGLLFSLSCGNDKGTNPNPGGEPVGKELQFVRANFAVTVQERIEEWMIIGPAAGVDVSFYPQLNDVQIGLGRTSLTTNNAGEALYICVAGSLYVGDTYTLRAVEIRTGCNTAGWQCLIQNDSRQETFTVIKGVSDYRCEVSAFATPE